MKHLTQNIAKFLETTRIHGLMYQFVFESIALTGDVDHVDSDLPIATFRVTYDLHLMGLSSYGVL